MSEHGYFLHKKSLLDKFKDDHKHTGYIQSVRAEHTWNNPLTRRKRTKELNGWIKSFAGKRHIHKLSRFNALNAGRYESLQVVHPDVEFDCLRYGSTLELPNGVCVPVRATIRCPRRGAFTFRVMGFGKADPDLYPDAGNAKCVIHGYYPVYGPERKPSDEFDIYCNDVSELQKWSDCNGWGMGVGPSASSMELAREVAKSSKTLSESTDEKLGYEKGHKNSRGENAPWVIRSHEDNRVLASFATEDEAKEHMKRMKQYSKGESKKSEGLESYACYIDFGSEDAAKDGMKLVQRWNPLRDGTAVMVDGIGEDAANSLWKDWLDQCIKAGLDIMDNGEVYKEEPSCIYGESKKSEALFNKTEMENVAIKAAVKAAWSAAKVKYFRIDFRDTHPGELNVYPVTSDGKDVGPFWGISTDKGVVYQYSTTWGGDEIEREMKFKDVDGIEEIFIDEFSAMDETLEISLDNGNDVTFIDSSDVKGESKKSEATATTPIWGVKVEYTPENGETRVTDVAPARDTEEQAKQAAIDRITQDYAPLKDIKIISIHKLPAWAAKNIRDLVNKKKSEDADDVTYELTEDAVTDLIKELGLEIVNTWYDGIKDLIVYDCKDMGDENGETVCVWVDPPYEARVWLKDANPRVNQLVEDIETIDALKAALVDIFKIELGESHITESLRKPEDTIIVPNWLWETYTLGENYDGDTLTDDEQQTYLDFKEKYEGFSLKAVSEKTTFRSDNDFNSNGCPCYEVNVFKK